MIRRFLDNYLPRHRNRINQALHLVGVPLSFIVAPVAAIAGRSRATTSDWLSGTRPGIKLGAFVVSSVWAGDVPVNTKSPGVGGANGLGPINPSPALVIAASMASTTSA